MESFRMMTLRSLQRVPVLSAVLGTVMCLLLSMEYDVLSAWCRAVFEIVVVSAGFVMVGMMSRYLRLCVMQRVGMFYTYSIMLCMWMMRYHGMSDMVLHYAHVTMMAVGIAYVLTVACALAAKKLSQRYKRS